MQNLMYVSVQAISFLGSLKEETLYCVIRYIKIGQMHLPHPHHFATENILTFCVCVRLHEFISTQNSPSFANTLTKVVMCVVIYTMLI